jgi:hypothetical protein
MNGTTRSCGCLQRQTVSKLRKKPYDTTAPEYKTWCSMKRRCYNPDTYDFKNWGARGIRVCPEWIDDYGQFLKDMGPRPGPDYSIDRIDVNGNYEPKNCRWATKSQQANNKRTSRILSAFGRQMTLSEWAKEIGVSQGTISARLDRSGMTVEQALTFKRHHRSA